MPICIQGFTFTLKNEALMVRDVRNLQPRELWYLVHGCTGYIGYTSIIWYIYIYIYTGLIKCDILYTLISS